MNILVLCGGTSTERDVSISSGTQVCKALRKRNHNAILVDVFRGAPINAFEEGLKADYSVSDKAFKYLHDTENVKQEIKENKKIALLSQDTLDLAKVADIVFMALHGTNGEDGRLQACFDLFGIKYTGADYLASAMSMDKTVAKTIVSMANVPVPRGTALIKKQYDLDPDIYTKKKLGFDGRAVVKPACGGSSVGVTFADDEEQFKKGLELSFSYEDKTVIEEYVGGREFSIGVIEGKALPIIEIITGEGEFYDYENKYNGSTKEVCPAPLSELEEREMKGYAEMSAKALGLSEYCRIDFLMDKEGKVYFLEANTLPGMTPTSLLPQEAAQEGMSFEDLCEKIINIEV